MSFKLPNAVVPTAQCVKVDEWTSKAGKTGHTATFLIGDTIAQIRVSADCERNYGLPEAGKTYGQLLVTAVSTQKYNFIVMDGFTE